MLTAFLPDQIKQFHQHINSIESSIQFMIEEAANGSTPSLDTRVIWLDDASLSTTVLRKQTHTNRYVDFTHLTTKLQWSEPCLPVQTRSVLSQTRRACHQRPQNNGYLRLMVDRNWHPTSSPLPSQEYDPAKAVVTLTSGTCQSSFDRSSTPWAAIPVYAPTMQTLR